MGQIVILFKIYCKNLFKEQQLNLGLMSFFVFWKYSLGEEGKAALFVCILNKIIHNTGIEKTDGNELPISSLK